MLASTLSWRENVEQSSTYQHCYRSRAKRALEASAMFIRQTRWVLQHVTGTRTLSNEHHQIEFLRCRHRCSRTAEHKKITRPLERAYQTFQRFFVVCVSISRGTLPETLASLWVPPFSTALAAGHTLINHLIKREQNKFTWSAERENGQI